jgi:hypothetical protein
MIHCNFHHFADALAVENVYSCGKRRRGQQGKSLLLFIVAYESLTNMLLLSVTPLLAMTGDNNDYDEDDINDKPKDDAPQDPPQPPKTKMCYQVW